MKVLDLFSGIGGFSLGLERAGMETVAFCEIEEYPRKILNKHWPDVPVFRDVRKLTKEVLLDEVSDVPDIIVGGFPCQPFSVAGKQKGQEDDRHLWPQMFRLIKEIRPRWVIGENVAGFIRMALDDVLSDLESEGYRCQAFVIPACAVGGVHRRDRVWIVAHSKSELSNGISLDGKSSEPQKPKSGNCNSKTDVAYTEHSSTERQRQHSYEILSEQETNGCNEIRFRENVADSDSDRRQERPDESRVNQNQAGSILKRHKDFREVKSKFARDELEPIGLPTESPVRHRDDGLSDNVARLKALGNAVVPQIPEMIGRAIMKIEA